MKECQGNLVESYLRESERVCSIGVMGHLLKLSFEQVLDSATWEELVDFEAMYQVQTLRALERIVGIGLVNVLLEKSYLGGCGLKQIAVVVGDILDCTPSLRLGLEGEGQVVANCNSKQCTLEKNEKLRPDQQNSDKRVRDSCVIQAEQKQGEQVHDPSGIGHRGALRHAEYCRSIVLGR